MPADIDYQKRYQTRNVLAENWATPEADAARPHPSSLGDDNRGCGNTRMQTQGLPHILGFVDYQRHSNKSGSPAFEYSRLSHHRRSTHQKHFRFQSLAGSRLAPSRL